MLHRQPIRFIGHLIRLVSQPICQLVYIQARYVHIISGGQQYVNDNMHLVRVQHSLRASIRAANEKLIRPFLIISHSLFVHDSSIPRTDGIFTPKLYTDH